MKKVASVLGFISCFFFTIAVLFKIQHYPGASIMTIVSLGFVAMLFIPSYFIARIIEEKSVIGKIGNVLALLSLDTLTLGILFKIQHYPGASLMCIMGTILFIFPTSILLLIAAFKNKESTNAFLKNMIIIFFAGIWVLFFGTSKFSIGTVEKVLFIDEQINDQVAIVEKTNQELYIKTINRNLSNEETEALTQLKKSRIKVTQFINDLDNELVTITGGKLSGLNNSGHWDAIGLKDSDVTSMLLLNKGAELKILLEEFDQQLIKSEALLAKKGIRVDHISITDLFPKRFNKNSKGKTWEMRYFDHTPAFIVFPMLSSLNAKVLSSERKILYEFTKGQDF